MKLHPDTLKLLQAAHKNVELAQASFNSLVSGIYSIHELNPKDLLDISTGEITPFQEPANPE